MIIEGDFERDGAVCVRGAVDGEHVELAREAIDANLADLSPRAKRASADDDGAFIEDFGNWPRLPAMERFIRESGRGRDRRRADGLRGRCGSTTTTCSSRSPAPASARRGTRTSRTTTSTAARTPACGSPSIPCPRASTLEFVAGSHRGEWYMPRTFLDDQAKWFPDGTLAELPDIDGRPDDFRILGWELEPGDAVFFHMLTLHAAGGVGGTNRRRVLSVRFLGDDMVHAPRPWTTSPPFPGLVDELPAGAPMDHPLFPVLWTTVKEPVR